MSSKFDEWWKVFPKKQGKSPARDLWLKLKYNEIADTIIGHTVTRAKEDEQWKKGFIPMPTTFLRQRRFEDEYVSIKPRYEPSTTIIDESIPNDGQLGAARAAGVCLQDDEGNAFNTEQLSKLTYAVEWQRRGIPDSKNVHLTQLPQSFHKYMDSGRLLPF